MLWRYFAGDAGVTIKLNNWKFFNTENYRGHVIHLWQLGVSEQNIEETWDSEPSANNTGLRPLWGWCNVSGRFVPNLAQIAQLLKRKLLEDQTTYFENLVDDGLHRIPTL